MIEIRLGIEKSTTRRRRPSAARRRALLALARSLACQHALGHALGLSTSDDVYRSLLLGGHDPRDLGPAAGSVFRDGKWEATALRIQSFRWRTRSEIKVWRYVGSPCCERRRFSRRLLRRWLEGKEPGRWAWVVSADDLDALRSEGDSR